MVTEGLWDWGYGDKIRAAHVIASELVSNVVDHTDSEPVLRVETDGAAVADRGTGLPALIETSYDRFWLGLHLVAALADAWGFVPSLDGKTVWATMFSE